MWLIDLVFKGDECGEIRPFIRADVFIRPLNSKKNNEKLYLLFALGALVACTGSPQKEKPASVNTPAEPFGGLPVFDLQGQYPKKEIILQDLADVRYVALETGDSSLVGTRPILMTDSLIVTVNKKSDVIFLTSRENTFILLTIQA